MKRIPGSRACVCWLAVLSGVMCVVGVMARSQTPARVSDPWDAFVDEFLAEPRQTGDLSPASFADQLAHTKAQLARLRDIDSAQLSADEALDRRFVETILVGRELAEERMRRWRMDPRIYMRSHQMIAPVLGRQGDLAARVDTILRTLRAIPVELRRGQNNLTLNVPRFQQVSLSLVDATAASFETGVPTFAESVPEQKNVLLAANAAARSAITEWVDFLKTQLPLRPSGYFAIGIETYSAMLRRQYLLPYDSDGLYQYAQSQFDLTVHELEALATEIDPKEKWDAIVKHVTSGDPKDTANQIDVHRQAVNQARTHIISKRLIPMPWKERVDIVPRSASLRSTGHYASFSSAALPPAADGTLIGQWQITPIDPTWDEPTKQEYRRQNDAEVVMVTAPHETYGGHHVQALYQLHNPSKVRRVLDASIFKEGWGLYSEQLMQETGFFPNERIHLRQMQMRLWSIARVICDVGIHTGRMTYEDAVKFMTAKAGVPTWAAEMEAGESADVPGSRLGYIGMTELLQIRDEFKEARGDRFSLSDFHERLLKIGAMPPALMRDALMR